MKLKQKKLFTMRNNVINNGRAMVKVKYADSMDVTTAAVCPACWNDPVQRKYLLKRMTELGVVTVVNQDELRGLYLEGKKHLTDCPHHKRPDN